MDVKQIEEHGKQLLKAASEGDPPATILKMLEDLKAVTATEKLLRQTQIGVKVNKLKTYKDPAVQRQAVALVNKWRGDVKKLQTNGQKEGISSTVPKAAAAAAGGAAAALPPLPHQQQRQEQAKPKYKGDPSKRNSKVDDVNTDVTGDKTRDNCVKLMYDGLSHMSDEPPDDILAVARAVELAAYNVYQPESNESYKTKLRSLYQNLKNKSNPQLRSRVFSGAISPQRFVTMSHDELKSAEQRAEDEKLQKENMSKAMVAQVEKSISVSLTCGKCGQKKVSYSQAQTRSADEPMTTFCECTVCGNRWKFS
ncbi:transcription elongation factor TFIIS [Elasticomyces elasticus]|nr:transcription elongation factor TFIIS [Elasticomyces elasticus]KAK5010521.1 hypothetical protein LTR28_009377 [Elasticomyces elasticus]